MIGQTTLDLGRIGGRNRPDPWFFGPKALPKLGSLLREDYCMLIAQKDLDLGRIGVQNGPDPGFFSPKLCPSFVSYSGKTTA